MGIKPHAVLKNFDRFNAPLLILTKNSEFATKIFLTRIFLIWNDFSLFKFASRRDLYRGIRFIFYQLNSQSQSAGSEHQIQSSELKKNENDRFEFAKN